MHLYKMDGQVAAAITILKYVGQFTPLALTSTQLAYEIGVRETMCRNVIKWLAAAGIVDYDRTEPRIAIVDPRWWYE